MYETILYDVADRVATITLNRPDKLNALNLAMLAELQAAFDAADNDDDVRCIILTGAGRAFCAGADLTTYSTDEVTAAPSVEIERDGGGVLALRIFDAKKPVIVAINGAAVGIGVSMILPCDIRLCADSAGFGFVFAKLGIVPDSAASWFLPRIVGIQTALEWCYAGRMVDAGTAVASGLVRSVHSSSDLLTVARGLATEIATVTSPVANALTRQLMWRMLGASHPMEAHRADSRAAHFRGASSDVTEGVRAFFDKRPGDWPDRVSTALPDIWDWWDEPSFR